MLIVGLVLALAVTGRNKTVRGAMYGGAAGLFFGTLAVHDRRRVRRGSPTAGWRACSTARAGSSPWSGAFMVGTAGMILTQMSFQVGALGATLPANLAADPGIAVVLGAIVLREHIPHSPVHVGVYVLCLAAVVVGAIRLADPSCRPDRARRRRPHAARHRRRRRSA